MDQIARFRKSSPAQLLELTALLEPRDCCDAYPSGCSPSRGPLSTQTADIPHPIAVLATFGCYAARSATPATATIHGLRYTQWISLIFGGVLAQSQLHLTIADKKIRYGSGDSGESPYVT